MKKAIKDVRTAPTTKIRKLMKEIIWEKITFIPTVKTLVAEVKLPSWLLNSSRNTVEATLNVKVAMVRPV